MLLNNLTNFIIDKMIDDQRKYPIMDWDVDDLHINHSYRADIQVIALTEKKRRLEVTLKADTTYVEDRKFIVTIKEA